MFMSYINFLAYGHTQELIKETGFCSSYWFGIDVIMVGKKIKE